MTYRAYIVKVETGEGRWYEMDGCEWGDGSVFFWTEGNFGCDCNRADSWLRAAGIEPEDDGSPCGDGAYRVPYVELSDGQRVQIDPPP